MVQNVPRPLLDCTVAECTVHIRELSGEQISLLQFSFFNSFTYRGKGKKMSQGGCKGYKGTFKRIWDLLRSSSFSWSTGKTCTSVAHMRAWLPSALEEPCLEYFRSGKINKIKNQIACLFQTAIIKELVYILDLSVLLGYKLLRNSKLQVSVMSNWHPHRRRTLTCGCFIPLQNCKIEDEIIKPIICIQNK